MLNFGVFILVLVSYHLGSKSQEADVIFGRCRYPAVGKAVEAQDQPTLIDISNSLQPDPHLLPLPDQFQVSTQTLQKVQVRQVASSVVLSTADLSVLTQKAT